MSMTVAVRRPAVLADAMPRSVARDAGLVLAAALLTAACAQITIQVPHSPVPVTGQTFAVLLTSAALGARRGALGQLLYVALGLFPPFYSDGASGPDVLLGATGGYLIGFIVAGFTPFILGGILKSTLAGLLLPGAWKLVGRR